MPLTKEQTQALVSLVANTCDDEIACDECLMGMAEFAETQLVGTGVPSAVRRIQAHIAFCPECAEEYELLLAMSV